MSARRRLLTGVNASVKKSANALPLTPRSLPTRALYARRALMTPSQFKPADSQATPAARPRVWRLTGQPTPTARLRRGRPGRMKCDCTTTADVGDAEGDQLRGRPAAALRQRLAGPVSVTPSLVGGERARYPSAQRGARLVAPAPQLRSLTAKNTARSASASAVSDAARAGREGKTTVRAPICGIACRSKLAPCSVFAQ